MKVERKPMAHLVELERRPVEVEPALSYQEIGVRSFARGLFIKPAITGAQLGDKRVFRIRKGDLVVSNVFGWEGAVAIAESAHDGLIGSHRFMTWAPRPGIDARYLFHYLASETGLAQLSAASPGSAGRNRTLSIKNFEQITCPIPELPDQRRIAAHLDSVEQFRAGNAAETNAVMALESAWLDRAFPIEDEMVPLNTVANVARGSTAILAADGEPFFGQASVRWGYLDASLAKRGASHWLDNVSPDRKTCAGDVLLNSTGDGTLGRAAVVTEEHAGHVTDSKILTIRTGESLMPGYLQLYLRSPAGRRQVLAAQGANTTKQTELGVRRAENLLVPVSPREKQVAIIAAWERMEVELRTMSALMKRRDKTLQSLLPAARNEVFNALQ